MQYGKRNAVQYCLFARGMQQSIVCFQEEYSTAFVCKRNLVQHLFARGMQNSIAFIQRNVVQHCWFAGGMQYSIVCLQEECSTALLVCKRRVVYTQNLNFNTTDCYFKIATSSFVASCGCFHVFFVIKRAIASRQAGSGVQIWPRICSRQITLSGGRQILLSGGSQILLRGGRQILLE